MLPVEQPMHRLSALEIFLGLTLLGCGHSGTLAASAGNQAAAPLASDSPSAIAPSPVAKEGPSNPDPAASASTRASAAANSLALAPASTEERFASGLIVNQAGVGGPGPGPELPKGTTILHVGDSFAGALGIELNKVLDQAGLRSVLSFETSTYIPTWAFDKRLGQHLSQYKPDLVLISLGANELQNPEPEKRIPLIRRIIERLGNRSCAWIAPVLWEGANPKLLEVIRANVAPCVYLDGNAFIVHMPRARDKIHPSMDARPDWARVIARWLAYHRKATSENPWRLVEGGLPR